MNRNSVTLSRSVLCVWLASACGGAPAKSAADSDTKAEAETASESPSGDEAGEAPAKATKSDEASPGTASKEDVQAVLQLVLDDEELTPYLHMERPDRFPIRIAGELPAGLELTKATQPVQVVDATETKDKKKPVIVFTEIDVQKDNASVRYRYDIESVRGSCTLGKRDGHWVLLRSRVTARSN